MIEIRLELTEETTVEELLQFATLAAEHAGEGTKVVDFPPVNMHEAQPQAALAFKPRADSKKTWQAKPIPHRTGITHSGSRPIDTL